MLKYTVKISHDCSYMFRFIWTIMYCVPCTAHNTHHSLKHFLPTLLNI